MDIFVEEITVTLSPDPDYRFEIRMGEEVMLAYKETNSKHDCSISFSSILEMEAVAKIMLKACKIYEA